LATGLTVVEAPGGNALGRGAAFAGNGADFAGKGAALAGTGAAFAGKGAAFAGNGAAGAGNGAAFARNPALPSAPDGASPCGPLLLYGPGGNLLFGRGTI